ncbi:hypothetical protein ABZY58_11500 [Micromonospora tulbaghiae]|uniref:hypothetical protein n=1 Tax=Micromonospora tulbaghiae TaxID=479978 RepID=UPI0033BD0A5A
MTSRRAATVALTAAVLLAAGCTGQPAPGSSPTAATPTASRPPLPLTVRGTFTLPLPHFTWRESTLTCEGWRTHASVRAGAQVTVSDPAGVVLGTAGQLDAGQPVVDPDDATRATACLFAFTVAGVPAGKGTYGVTVADRGKVLVPEAKLSETLTLGLS